MEIKTKFSVGDTVWIMLQNKPIECKVHFIEIMISSTHQTCLYHVKDDISEIIRLNTNLIFKTKKELIDSL